MLKKYGTTEYHSIGIADYSNKGLSDTQIVDVFKRVFGEFCVTLMSFSMISVMDYPRQDFDCLEDALQYTDYLLTLEVEGLTKKKKRSKI